MLQNFLAAKMYYSRDDIAATLFQAIWRGWFFRQKRLSKFRETVAVCRQWTLDLAFNHYCDRLIMSESRNYELDDWSRTKLQTYTLIYREADAYKPTRTIRSWVASPTRVLDESLTLGGWLNFCKGRRGQSQENLLPAGQCCARKQTKSKLTWHVPLPSMKTTGC